MAPVEEETEGTLRRRLVEPGKVGEVSVESEALLLPGILLPGMLSHGSYEYNNHEGSESCACLMQKPIALHVV
jgi:hypothetical protein